VFLYLVLLKSLKKPAKNDKTIDSSVSSSQLSDIYFPPIFNLADKKPDIFLPKISVSSINVEDINSIKNTDMSWQTEKREIFKNNNDENQMKFYLYE
jgi:hypothetical protein